jgi:mono/diheme cytochrome c family protein
MRTAGLAAATVVGLALMVHAQAPVPREQPPLIIKSTAGSELFKFYCSNCHGLDAKGRAASSAAKSAAPDLTTLALRNAGAFPRDRVLAIITHGSDSPAAHGANGMPVWGAIFRGLEPNEALVDIRIANLLQYLESIQQLGVGRAALESEVTQESALAQ